METITQIANIFSAGIGDIFSIHKIITILINNRDVLMETIRILGSNFAMLLGSIATFRMIISPSISSIQGTLGVDEEEFQLISTCFHLLWVVPIYILCYMSSLAWYQNLADLTYKHVHGGAPKTASIKVALTQTVYSTLVWLFIFIEVQIVTIVLPLIFQYISNIIILNLYDNNPIASSTQIVEILTNKIFMQSVGSVGAGLENIEITTIQWISFLICIIPLKCLSLCSYMWM